MDNCNSDRSEYERGLLDAWESTYKQGQLSLWIFLALYQSPKVMSEIRDYIANVTDGIFSVDDKSLYRSLRRYYDTEIVDFRAEPSQGKGPEQKRYSLTPMGKRVLIAFVERNTAIVVKNEQIKEILR